jgi:predicted esterase
MHALVLLASSLLSCQEPAGVDPEDLLEHAVDLPTSAARQEAALALARRADVTLEDWLRAAAAFGRFEPVAPGVHEEHVELEVGLPAPEAAALWLSVPKGYDPHRPAPLLVALHGMGGTGEAALAAWREAAERIGMLVLAPSEAGANEGYSFSARERDSVLAALRWTRRRFNVDENRIHLTGFSRGGHLAWDLALRHPDLFASLVPMVGGPRVELAEGRNNMRYLENLAGVPIRDLQGARDDPLLVSDVRLAFKRLASWKAADAELLEFAELAHDVDMKAVDWTAFFQGETRVPRPSRVVRCAARPGEGRAFWVEILATGKDVEETFAPRVNAAAWNSLSKEAQREKLEELA